MHQDLGLDKFNTMPTSKAVHALFECCCSVTWANAIARQRPYESYEALLDRADTEFREMSDADVDLTLQCHPTIGSRAKSEKSRLEQSSLSCGDAALMVALVSGCTAYGERFGYRYVACTADRDADEILMDITHRLDNDPEIERKVMRNELSKIHRTRIERMLGPEEGYPLY